MIADMSVAPEIARLAGAALFLPAQPAGAPGAPGAPGEPRRTPDTGPPPTLGTLAGRLREIAAAPERWWGLVRFDPDRSVKISVEERPGYQAWLAVLPPGDPGRDCDCDAAAVIAGEVTEGAPGSAPLRPGPVRVHGGPHRLRGRGAGYSISLHARAEPEPAPRGASGSRGRPR